MTYERLHVTDQQILDVMAVARKHGALVMVHAENHGVISWLADRMIEQGNVAPRYHGICHTRGAEHEAIQRVAMLAELIDVPILIVHVSTDRGHRGDPAGARARRQDLRRDLPAVPLSHREGPRPAGARRRDVLLQPAAARRGRAAGVLARACGRRAECVLVRSLAVSLR